LHWNLQVGLLASLVADVVYFDCLLAFFVLGERGALISMKSMGREYGAGYFEKLSKFGFS